MAEWIPPRRIVSTPTFISVNAAASTALATAASTMVSGEFKSFVQASYWQRTQDSREPTATETSPATNYRWASPTEQGDAGHGLGYTMLDWGSKAAWDPVSKRVMFCGNGANPIGSTVRIYSWQYTKYCYYDEATDNWVQERGIKGDNEGADPDCSVHLLSNNCIDVNGRRFFKKKFREARILVKNLTTGTWTTIASPASEASYNRSGGMDFIPNRGAAGVLWSAITATDGYQKIFETDPTAGGGTLLVDRGVLGDQVTNDKYGTPCVYNPRAFGGAGGVLVGATVAKKVTCPNSGAPTVYDAGVAINGGMWASVGHRICRDPIGDGWYHFISGPQGTAKVYRTAGNAGPSSWVEVATMPEYLCDALNLFLCPIDDYGVIWCMTSYLSWPNGQNGHQAWLWKP